MLLKIFGKRIGKERKVMRIIKFVGILFLNLIAGIIVGLVAIVETIKEVLVDSWNKSKGIK
jgi:hypothetical protein